MKYQHARLLPVPGAHSLCGGRLERIQPEQIGRRQDVLIDYLELIPNSVSKLHIQKGYLVETIEGAYKPRRLRLHGVHRFVLEGLYRELNRVPADHPVRDLRGCLYFRATSGIPYFLLFPGAGPASLQADPRRCVQEDLAGMDRNAVQQAVISRDWSPAPPSPPRLVPVPKTIHHQFGGNPVTVLIGKRNLKRRLFIGDISMQGAHRPQVDAVLNLGEEAPVWYKEGEVWTDDRWSQQGEGTLGMDLETLISEAYWVIDRLQRGKRVLVHCLAGMNRSAAVCCAVLIQLEGLSAEGALARLRQHHPWAHPDATHWLRLRWMAKTIH